MSAGNMMDEKQGRRRRRRQEPEEEIEQEDGELEEEEDVRGLTERKGRPTPGRRGQTEVVESGNFVVRSVRGLRDYLEGVRSELEKVAWPTREETRRLTTIVLATTIASALILGVISLVFTELFRLGLDTPAIFIVVIAIGIGIAYYFIRAGDRRSSTY